MDIRDQREIGAKRKKAPTLKQLREQAKLQEKRERASGSYNPSPERIARMSAKFREQREAARREDETELVREFLDEDDDDE